MQARDFTFTDSAQNERQVPICVYLPDDVTDVSALPIVIFSPGYRPQEELKDPSIAPPYKNYTYLAAFFTSRNYAFISVQHDLIGDTDGLESIDPTLPHYEARKHIYARGERTLLFTIAALKERFPAFEWENILIAGHSNGGDIAKYFANHHPALASRVIALDARRCPIAPRGQAPLSLLMFEATDTSTEPDVIPHEGTEADPTRANLEWMIIKPKNALHKSYSDRFITEELKHSVCRTMVWFLENP